MKRWASALLTVGSVGLMTFPALAQGIAVNSTLYAGSFNPPTLPSGMTAFLPYGFNVTLGNGDIYQILGTANLASGNSSGGEFLNFPFLLTYLGNTAGPQPSQSDTIKIDGFAAFQGFNGTVTENLTTTGIFSGFFPPNTNFNQYLTVNGAVSGNGPFDPPGTFSGSTSVTAPAGTRIDNDITSQANFGSGTPVGSLIAVGSFPSIPVAAILPGSRSVQVGKTATVFGTMINTGTSTANDCQVSLPSDTPNTVLSLTYQATNPTTNALIGTPNTPVTIAPGAAQSFVLSFQATGPISETPLIPLFVCTDSVPAQTTSGVDTVNLLFSQFPVPDIIALALTTTDDGTVHLDITGLGFFVVATDNLGISSPITATVTSSPNAAPLLNGLTICQTNPATSDCLAPPTSSSVNLTINNGAQPTFAIFASSAAPVPFQPAINRINVNFTDSGGTLHGSTSVAVASQ
jgi:hypothetical protein